jgi:hypothetical protein
MITPEKIQELAEPIESIYAHIVDALLINIGKHIMSPTWTHTANWEIQKLAELGQLTQENAAIINKWVKKIPPAMRETMEATRAAALDKIEQQLEQAAQDGYIAPAMTDSTGAVFQEYFDQAAEKLNMVNTTMLESSVNQFPVIVHKMQAQITEEQTRAMQGILNNAAGSVIVGSETWRNAAREAIREAAEEGLTGFVDRAGRTWSPEAYVNMDIRTTVHNTAVQATRARMQDYGTQVFQVSSHAGARPLCYPYQGKFYSWDNSAGEIELGNGKTVKYEPLSSTSYGKPAGLFGINCGHEPIVVIPGVSIPHGADAIQDEEANKKQYEQSQQQRALERKIRAAKRVVAMGDDSEEAKQRVKDAQADMREFINETGRRRRYDREQI